jgi:ribosomal protein S27AE
MVSAISMVCPGCGASLTVKESLKRFNCGYCGGSLEVVRDGGTITLESVEQAIRGMHKGVNCTASELALVRLNKELVVEQGNLQVLQSQMPRIEDIEKPRWADRYVYFVDTVGTIGSVAALIVFTFSIVMITAILGGWGTLLSVMVVIALTVFDYRKRYKGYVEEGVRLDGIHLDAIENWEKAVGIQLGKIESIKREIAEHMSIVQIPLDIAD